MKANNRTTDECLTEMLKHWLNCDPSWSDLVQALSSEPVGENAIARQIHTKYCATQGETDAGNETTGDNKKHLKCITLGQGGSIRKFGRSI